MHRSTRSSALSSNNEISMALRLPQSVCQREGVGVEPTAAGSAPPATGFEDRDAHRDASLPTVHSSDSRALGKNHRQRLSRFQPSFCGSISIPLQFGMVCHNGCGRNRFGIASAKPLSSLLFEPALAKNRMQRRIKRGRGFGSQKINPSPSEPVVPLSPSESVVESVVQTRKDL